MEEAGEETRCVDNMNNEYCESKYGHPENTDIRGRGVLRMKDYSVGGGSRIRQISTDVTEFPK